MANQLKDLLRMRIRGNYYIGAATAAIVFGLLVLGMESLNCEFFSAKCHADPALFAFPYIIFIVLGLFILGCIANAPLFILAAKLQKTIPSKKGLFILVAGIGPSAMYLFFTLFSRSLSEIPLSEWRYFFAISGAGVVAGSAMLWMILPIKDGK